MWIYKQREQAAILLAVGFFKKSGLSQKMGKGGLEGGGDVEKQRAVLVLGPSYDDTPVFQKLDDRFKDLFVFFQDDQLEFHTLSLDTGGGNLQNPLAGQRNDTRLLRIQRKTVFAQKSVRGIPE